MNVQTPEICQTPKELTSKIVGIYVGNTKETNITILCRSIKCVIHFLPRFSVDRDSIWLRASKSHPKKVDMNVLIGDNIVLFFCVLEKFDKWVFNPRNIIIFCRWWFQIGSAFLAARQLLRELPRQWRLAYLFFAFAYMLIVGTGDWDPFWRETQIGIDMSFFVFRFFGSQLQKLFLVHVL